MIRKRTPVLRRRMIWRGCIDKNMRWWCVRSRDKIQMVHWSIRNGSRVADELYIKRVLLALQDFLFFSLYSFSCIEKQVTTLKQLQLLSCLVLSSFSRNELRVCYPAFNITLLLPISPTPNPARYINYPMLLLVMSEYPDHTPVAGH
jgi:hypothetical protein